MLPKNYQVEKNHESYRRNNCKNNHENNYTRKTAKKQHKLFLIFLLLVFISSSLNPLSSYAAGTGSVGTSAGQSNVGTGQPSLFALLEETALGAGFVPLGVNEPASVTFTVNATEDASFINGVKFTLEDVVVGGTDDKGDPLVYESVSVGLPNHLTMANSFSLPTDWVCIQSGGNITIWTIFNPETSGTKAIVEDFLTNTYAAQLTSRASATSLKDYDFPDSGETIGVKVSASVSPSSWNEAFVPQPVIAQHRNVLSGLTLSEDVLYIGKIGEAYLTQPITPPPAHYYAGVKQYSAPAAGTFTSDRQWVEHIYDNTYPVVYDPNSASAEGQMSDSTVRHGEDFMLKPNYYTLQGYTFEGWNTEPDGSGDFYADYHEFTPWQFTSTLTLYAQWRSDNIVLILDKNADNAIVGITQLNHLVYGQTLTAQGVDIFVAPPVRPFPYQVIGWATTKALADAGTADFTNDSLVDWLDTKTIYAVWGTQPPSGNVEVTFDANGGTAASPASVTATVGEPYGTFPNTTRPWHYLIGWYTDPIGGSQVEETTVVTDASDHTLYAHWEMLPLVLCGLEFDKNAADATAGSVTQMTVGMGPSLRDQGMTLPDTGSGAPTRPGYEFAGWATTPELADAYIADFTDDSPVDWLRSKTVYAIWVGAQVEVTFDANGGAVMSPGRLAVIFGGSYGTLLSASRPGYDFAGWFTEPTGGTQVTAVTMVTNYSNHTLYAHWSPVSGGGSNIDLTFSVNITASAAVTNGYEYTLENAVVNGTDVNGAPLTYGSVSITLPHGLTLESFSFFPPSGWVMTQAGNSATWIISNPATNGTKAIVEDFLNNRFFATLTTADVFPDDDTKIIVEVNEGQIPTWVDPNGFVHYYEYVPASGITWLNAYNAAKARTYNGLPGYLMTITSQEEQDFIYGSIGKTMGFMGGTRAVHDSSKAKILDDASLSTNTNDFDKEFTYGVEWYWACGPEAGLVFYGKPTVSMAGTGPISGVYSNWYSTEPDAYGGGAEKAAFLEVYQAGLWGDLANTYPVSTYPGYYVEYGGYTAQTPVGNSRHEAFVPQPVFATHKDATNQTTIGTDVHIGKIGDVYAAPSITPPAGYSYAGLEVGSDPEIGAFASKKQYVTHLYDVVSGGGGSAVTLTFEVNLTTDSINYLTDLYKYTLENAVVNGTDATGAPLTYGSVSITLPDGLTLGSFTAPTGWAPTQTGNNSTWIISNPDTNGTKAIVEDFLNNIFYARLTNTSGFATGVIVPGDFPDDNTKIIVEVSAAQTSGWVGPNGLAHYYEFVPAQGITWLDAYNAAKGRTHNGSQGYLATITSQEEQNFVYNSVAKSSGWLGGTRILNTAGAAPINDETSIPNALSDYTYNNTADKWYWACGPEAGLVFGNGVTRNASFDVSGVYHDFHNTAPNNTYNGGPEYCLQFAYSGDKWNDLANNYPVAGYYVEYGGYTSDTRSEAFVPQPVFGEYWYTAGGGELSGTDIYVGKIGTAYSASPIASWIVGMVYVGLDTGSDPETGAFTSEKKFVKHLYAHPIFITYDKNSVAATGTMANDMAIYGTNFALTPNAYTRAGYTFDGWNTKPDGSGVSYADGYVFTPQDFYDEVNWTLYAQWQTVNSGGSNITLTFIVNTAADATVTNGFKYTLENAVVVGTDANGAPLTYGSVSITLPDGLTLESFTAPTGWALTQSGNSATWIISNPATNGTKAIVEDFLNNSFSAYLTAADVFPDDGEKIVVEVSTGQISSWTDPNGYVHYYEFVGPRVTWLDAYNAAKARTYNGLPGYLATITSQEEQDFIYNSIAKSSGWLGGTRMLQTAGAAPINDETSLSNTISDYTYAVTADKWYWACGPEAGLVFGNGATINANFTVPGVYQHFNTGEPNNSGGEYCLQFAASGDRWNDLAYSASSVAGYYVEYGGYQAQTPIGSGRYEAFVPQPVFESHKNASNQASMGADAIYVGKIGVPYTSARITPPTGWSHVGLAQGSAPETGTFTSAKQYVAHLYDADTYSVIYDKNAPDATGTMVDGTAKYDAIFVVATNTYTREGYLFDGWNTAADGSGVSYAENHAFTPWQLLGDLTLYAQWTEKDGYEVIYDLNGATSPLIPPLTNVKWTQTNLLPTTPPTRTGYTFTGWDALGWSATDVQDSASFASIVGSDQVLLLALQAQWSPKTVEVTFDAAGGTPTSPASVTVTFDAPYGALPLTTQTGYVFDGWFDAPTGGTQVVAATVVSNAVNHTLYAHWHAASGILLTFDKYAADAAAGAITQIDALVFGQTLTAQGKTLPATGSGAPTRTGYDFIGWASSQALADAGTADFTDAALVDWTTSKTVYAVWQAKTVDVTFDATGGTPTSPAQITVTFDQPYGTLPSTTQAGYAFDGWFDAPTGGTQVTATTVVSNASNHTLYAHWHAAGGVILTFDSNAANATPGTPAYYDDLVFGQTLTAQGKLLPATGSGAPTRTGYDFIGWASSQALADAGTADFTSNNLVDWTASKTVYAVWSAKTLSVSFDTGGGTPTSPAQITVVFGQPYGTLPSTAKTGSVFDGWFDAPTGGTQVISSTTVSNPNNHSLYAYWHLIDDIVLTFDRNAPDAQAGSTTRWDDLVFGQSLAAQGKNLPAAGNGAPERYGYDFVGWASSQTLADAGTADITNGTLVDWPSATSKTAYAVWSAKAVDVHFYNNYTSGDTAQYASGNAANSSRRYADKLSLPAAPTRQGYTFTGWFDARSGGRYWDFDAWGINVHPTLNLYAQWRAQPTVPAARVITLPSTVIQQQGETTPQTPLMISVKANAKTTQTDIADPTTPTTVSATPAAEPQGHWSLMNLNLTIAAAFLFVLLLLNRKRRNPALTLIAATVTAAALALFLFTQDLTQPMQLVDIWTVSYAALALLQAGVWVFSRSGEEEAGTYQGDAD